MDPNDAHSESNRPNSGPSASDQTGSHQPGAHQPGATPSTPQTSASAAAWGTWARSAGASHPAAMSGTPAQIVYLQAAPGPIRRWFSWLGWVGFFFAITALLGLTAAYQQYFDTSNGIQEKYVSGSKTAADKVALVEVAGMIGTDASYVKNQIDRISADQSVKAVVVRVNSPGGTITGSDYILHHLNQMREEREIPVVVSMGSIAASGGYYVAMAVGDTPGTIFAEPTTTTGSIGVIIPHYDVSGLLERYDIKDDSLVSHPRKKMLSMTSPTSDEDREVLEAYLNDAFQRFKEVVRSGRPSFREDESKLDQLATGEIFTATRAQEAGLVDQLGFVEDAIERAAELAQLSDDGYRVVKYKAPLTLVEALASAQAGSRAPALDVRSLIDFGVPKAYYLATSVPALATSWTTLSARD